MAQKHTEKLLKLTRKVGLLRPRDLQAAGIPRVYLKQLVEEGELLKTGRGLYVRADASLTENHSLGANTAVGESMCKTKSPGFLRGFRWGYSSADVVTAAPTRG